MLPSMRESLLPPAEFLRPCTRRTKRLRRVLDRLGRELARTELRRLYPQR